MTFVLVIAGEANVNRKRLGEMLLYKAICSINDWTGVLISKSVLNSFKFLERGVTIIETILDNTILVGIAKIYLLGLRELKEPVKTKGLDGRVPC